MLKKLILLVLCIAAMHKSAVAMDNKYIKYAAIGLASYYVIVKPAYIWCGAKIELKRNPQALHAACRYGGDVEHVKLLLTVGADVNAQDKYGWAPLHYAAYWNNKEITAVLIQAGAALHAQDENGLTPLHTAAFGSKEVAEMLIQAGADLHARDVYGYTPLHTAVHRNKKEVSEVLIQAGADLHARDVHGYTPLHVAVHRNEKEVAEVLIQAGSDLHARDVYGDTPLHVAALKDKQETIETLINKTFFYPSIAGTRCYKHTLQEQCLDVLLKKWHTSDKEYKDAIITGIDCCLDINPKHSQALMTIAEHAPLALQQNVIKMWYEHKSVENDNKMRLFLEAHSERHLANIKKVLAIRNNYQNTARGRAQSNDHRLIVQLLDEVTNAKKFSDLKLTMQQAITCTIKEALKI